MRVIKRNGAEVEFDIVKIIAAVTKANAATEEDARMTPMQIRRIAESVENSCLSMNRALSVEEIQDLVEDQIMAHGAFEVAKNYITYRYTRTLVRKSNTTDEKILSLIESNTFSGITISVSLPQSSKAPLPIRFNLSGKETEINPPHFSKALSSISVTELGIDMANNLLHVPNVPLLILVSFLGRSSSTKLLQYAKAYSSISVTLSGMVIEANLVQYSKAPLPMVVRFSVICMEYKA